MTHVLVAFVLILVSSAGRAAGADNAPAASCRAVVGRYGALPGKVGESPLRVLRSDRASGVKVATELARLDKGVPDLVAWAAQQTPPIDMSDVLKDESMRLMEPYGSSITFPQLPGTSFHAVHSTSGTAHCLSSTYFEVTDARARIASAPPGLEDDIAGASCMISRSFGSIDSTPVMFEEAYSYGPSMESTLTVASWHGNGFAGACRVTFYFEPDFREETLNDWGDCNGADCGRLQAAAFKIAKAVQQDPQQARREFASRLSTDQALEYANTEATVVAQTPEVATQRATDPDKITKEYPFRLPYAEGGHLYVVSVGHFTIGWRYFSDWSVVFHEIVGSQLTERAAFPIGMWKGAVLRTDIETL